MFKRPIAHRGLHKITGELENTTGAFMAAIAADYAIECDIQLSADGEAVVFHDFTLDRLMTTKGLVTSLTTAELKNLSYFASKDKIITLQELLHLVNEVVPLIIEIKSAFTGDMTLTDQAIRTLSGYKNAALMSFDPEIIAHLKKVVPHIMRGIVSQSRYEGEEWAKITPENRQAMIDLTHLPKTDPHFISWKVQDLPARAVTDFQKTYQRPVICWTVRTEADRQLATLHADQVTFEGYLA